MAISGPCKQLRRCCEPSVCDGLRLCDPGPAALSLVCVIKTPVVFNVVARPGSSATNTIDVRCGSSGETLLVLEALEEV